MKTIIIDGFTYELRPLEQPKLAQTIEEVENAIMQKGHKELEPIAKTMRARNKAFEQLLFVVAYCNERFERDLDGGTWEISTSKYIAQTEEGTHYYSPLQFHSEEAAQYARDTFWPIFQQWFTGLQLTEVAACKNF